MVQYQVLFEVSLSHKYYSGPFANDYEVIMTASLQAMMKSYKLIFKKKAEVFAILGKSDHLFLLSSSKEAIKFRFGIQLKNRYFENFSKIRPAAPYMKYMFRNEIYQKNKNGESEKQEINLHAGKLLSELRNSVNLRKISDVPVGVFLSGGIDSSTNAALFSEDQKEPLNSFSIAYDNNYKSAESELNYAKRVAKDVGAKYHDQSLNQEDLIRFLPKMVFLQDEPIADPVCVPVYYVSALERKNNVIVCQVGEGADELFFGYESWKKRLRVQKLANLPIPIFIKKAIVFMLGVFGKDMGWKYEYLRRDSDKKPIFWGGSGAYTEMQKRRILSSRMREKFKNVNSWSALTKIRERFLKKCDSTDIYRWMTYIDLNARLPDLLLMRVDNMAMGVSLEGRVPFLDPTFVAFALTIPNNYQTKVGY